MAKPVDDSDLWLPSHFLTAEEGVLRDNDNINNGFNADLDAAFGFPSEFPYEFDSFGISSSLSSPVESVAGSTETESSDEDDFFVALTQRLSQSSIHESRKQLTAPIYATDKVESQKTRSLARSPQSILSGIGSWSGRSAVSGDGSPGGSSQVPSPPTTPFSANNNVWEVIYAAAGRVARLKMNESDFQNRGLLSLPHDLARNPSAALFSNQSLAYTLNHASQHQRVREEQVLKQQCGSGWGGQAKPNWLAQQHQVQNGGGYECVRRGRSLTLPQPTRPPLQVRHQKQPLHQHNGAGSRPVLHGGSNIKKGCTGTGVFLPRHYGNPSESRKKTSCAPVMVPAKVVHALNLNIDELNATSHSQPRFSSACTIDYGALLARRNTLLMQQGLSVRREEAASYEIRLPQEWTY